MSPEMAGVLGIVLLFMLLAIKMYIGMAMALVGFLGLVYLTDFQAGLSVLSIVPLEEGSSYTLSVIPLFVVM